MTHLQNHAAPPWMVDAAERALGTRDWLEGVRKRVEARLRLRDWERHDYQRAVNRSFKRELKRHWRHHHQAAVLRVVSHLSGIDSKTLYEVRALQERPAEEWERERSQSLKRFVQALAAAGIGQDDWADVPQQIEVDLSPPARRIVLTQDDVYELLLCVPLFPLRLVSEQNERVDRLMARILRRSSSGAAERR